MVTSLKYYTRFVKVFSATVQTAFLAYKKTECNCAFIRVILIGTGTIMEENNTIDWKSLQKKYPQSMTDKLANLPEAPGCYLFKNNQGRVIYVGKAKVLKNRVRSYFQKSSDTTRRIMRMIFEVVDLDWIVTDSELEALILENNLIKKHKPDYNVMLRDDKSYPYIVITLSDEWPRVESVRKLRMKKGEKDKYYGPYTDSMAVRETLKIIRKVFGVPCGYKRPQESKGKPCMYYHIGQCVGPCTGSLDKEEYMRVIRNVMAFLEGRQETLVDELMGQMEEASEDLQFEKAARLRDQVQAIQKLIARQKVIYTACEDQDVIAIVTDDFNSCAEVFFIRTGKLVGQEHFLLQNVSRENLVESMEQFILQYYDKAPFIPREILLSERVDEMQIITSWLRQKRGAAVSLVTPVRGEKRGLVDMARKNADLVLQQLKLKIDADTKRTTQELGELKDYLGLPTTPRRIEAYDISNIQGQFTVASLVVFEDGMPKKEHYRRFKIKYTEGSPDDYASMREVVARRLTGSLRRSPAFSDLPDLMLIDGGKGQLASALEVVEAMEEDVPVVGLAKRNEEIFRPYESSPVILPPRSGPLHLVQKVRDEAHRFAITYHRNLRGKAMKESVLNKIEGVGPKRRKALVKHFGSVEKIKAAGVEELAGAPGVNRSTAQSIFDYFHGGKNENG